MKENKVNPQHINTKLLHGYKVIDQHTGAASIPIYQTSTFHNHKLYSSDQEYLYTRFSNPTIDALEDGFCCLENASYALAYSSVWLPLVMPSCFLKIMSILFSP